MSLLFLLCANDRDQYKVLLQQLLVLSFDKTKKTDFLKTWAKNKNEWKNMLVEALCLIQAKFVIHQLGLDCSELQQRFLPFNHYTTSHINLIVKLLYYVCEQLTIKQSKILIDYMQNKFPSIRNFIYSDNGEYLEIYLLNWLWENVIHIGKTDDQSM